MHKVAFFSFFAIQTIFKKRRANDFAVPGYFQDLKMKMISERVVE